jgi:hypothetical protein
MLVIFCKHHPIQDDRQKPTGDCVTCAIHYELVKWLSERPGIKDNLDMGDAERQAIFNIVKGIKQRSRSRGKKKVANR